MLKLEHVVKKYHNHLALQDLSFTAERGQIIGLLGNNGAGKSTTMNMIAGYFAPTAGRITWDGIDIARLGPAYQQEIGYLPETPPLHPELTVRESMEYVCGLRGIRPSKRKAHILELCEMTDVADRLNMPTRSLSKGYKQRVGLAQALIGNPSLIVLDEPTAGLDPEQIISIRELIRELGKEHAVILSSHILSEIDDVCSSLVILRKGVMAASGTVAEIAAQLRTEDHKLRLRVAGERAREVLSALPGVKAVQSLPQRESGWMELLVISAGDVSALVPAALAAAGVQLRMLYPMDVELEDLFMKLMQEEVAPC